jgi:hypothetical protein
MTVVLKSKRPGKLGSLPGQELENQFVCEVLHGNDPQGHYAANGGLFSAATTRAGLDREH